MGIRECARRHRVEWKNKAGKAVGNMRSVVTEIAYLGKVRRQLFKTGLLKSQGNNFLHLRKLSKSLVTWLSNHLSPLCSKQQNLKNLCDKKKTQARSVREPWTLGGKEEGIPRLRKEQHEAGAPQCSPDCLWGGITGSAGALLLEVCPKRTAGN